MRDLPMRRRTTSRDVLLWGLAWASLAGALATSSQAAEVKFFRTDSKESFSKGTASSVAVSESGELVVGGQVNTVADLEQPYVYTAASSGSGWVLGTGVSGEVLRVSVQGEVEALIPLAEEHVFAVAEADGVLWAGSSPAGQLYRHQGDTWATYAIHGAAEDLYIWAIEPFPGGAYVATGAQGRVLRVSADGDVEDLTGEVDTHVRAILELPGGDLLLGTHGAGKVMLWSEGRAQMLYSAQAPEITALAHDGAGTCFAAEVESPAGWVASAAQAAAAATQNEANGQVTISEVPSSSAGSPRAALLRFACSGGAVERIAEWQGETIFDLAWFDGQLWVGTGAEGKVYRIDEAGVRYLAHDFDNQQVVSLIAADGRLAVVTTNSGSIAVLGAQQASIGEFESAVLDAGQVATPGALAWFGSGEAEFSLRSGQIGVPDDSWGEWTDWRSGSSIDFIDLPPARFFQWRSRLHGDARISRVDLAHRQLNLPPRITELEVLPSGEVLVDSSFNPGQQVYEPTRPARDGIFTGLTAAAERNNGQRTKTLWKAGAQSFRWKGEDPNGDSLRYAIDVRPVSGGAWITVVEDLDDPYYTLDATVLPDGEYRFRLRANDHESNPGEGGAEAEATSSIVVIDHTPPRLGTVSRQGGQVRVEISDQASPLRTIEVSRGGKSWTAVEVVDGSVDEMKEEVVLEAGEDGEFVILRATDWAYNHRSFALPSP